MPIPPIRDGSDEKPISSSVVSGKRLFAFDRNDPYDRESKVPADALAIWYLGQNGFILKASKGPVIGIDLYLSNSCAAKFSHLPFRFDRQIPVFVEPEGLAWMYSSRHIPTMTMPIQRPFDGLAEAEK